MPQPRTTQDRVNDLHALLGAAAIPGPYVLVGHSAGGLVVRLFASEYPDEVVGMVLLDSTHEDVWLRFQEAMTPDQWAEFEALTVTNQDLLDAYPEAERWFTAPLADDATTGQVRQARKDAPLRPMPLVVLAHGIPFADPFPGWPSDKMEGIMFALQQDLAQLVPDARLIIATESGHNIHQDQPELVIDAIQQVVAAVRDPSGWVASPRWVGFRLAFHSELEAFFAYSVSSSAQDVLHRPDRLERAAIARRHCHLDRADRPYLRHRTLLAA